MVREGVEGALHARVEGVQGFVKHVLGPSAVEDVEAEMVPAVLVRTHADGGAHRVARVRTRRLLVEVHGHFEALLRTEFHDLDVRVDGIEGRAGEHPGRADARSLDPQLEGVAMADPLERNESDAVCEKLVRLTRGVDTHVDLVRSPRLDVAQQRAPYGVAKPRTARKIETHDREPEHKRVTTTEEENTDAGVGMYGGVFQTLVAYALDDGTRRAAATEKAAIEDKRNTSTK